MYHMIWSLNLNLVCAQKWRSALRRMSRNKQWLHFIRMKNKELKNYPNEWEREKWSTEHESPIRFSLRLMNFYDVDFVHYERHKTGHECNFNHTKIPYNFEVWIARVPISSKLPPSTLDNNPSNQIAQSRKSVYICLYMGNHGLYDYERRWTAGELLKNHQDI